MGNSEPSAVRSANAISPDIFWAEISPCEHIVQLYENEAAFLDPLAVFVLGGIKAGEGVIVIATSGHIASLEAQLAAHAAELERAQANGQYVAFEAQEFLERFMVDGWPDENLFRKTISDTVRETRQKFSRIRAFGEMVALLWAQGHTAATVRLEYLWHQVYRPETITLLCAYPRTGFTKSPESSIHEIVNTHSRILQAA